MLRREDLRTCRPWPHLHLSKKLKGKCGHDINVLGLSLGTQGQSHPCGYGWNFPGKKWAFHWDSFWEELYLRTGNEDSRGGAPCGVWRKTSFCLRAWGLQKGDAREKPDVSPVTLNASPSVHPARVTNGPREWVTIMEYSNTLDTAEKS